MSERMEFVTRHQAGERMIDLCREFGISRKTGYKLVDRYRAEGLDALLDRSRRPLVSPRRIDATIAELVAQERRDHVTWGPRKLRASLAKKHPGVELPAISTIWKLLKARGLVPGRRKRRRTPPHTEPLRHATAPNELWCVDFKGQFRMGNGQYCYPLTLTDAFSRYILGCVALDSTEEEGAMRAMSSLFREHGLPKAIRSDNGTPFATQTVQGLSRLSVWWRKLGIDHERIDAGHPEQNGRHERMHRTLKQETTRPPGAHLLQQQDRFDRFCAEFNNDRPHEALDDATPATRHVRSERDYPTTLIEPAYPLHDDVCSVGSSGHIFVPKGHRKHRVYVSRVLAGEVVGVRELDEHRWQVTFMKLNLGIANLAEKRLEW